MELAIKKIVLELSDDELFLITQRSKHNEFIINLIDITNSKTYSGKVSEMDLRALSATVRMQFSAFLCDTIAALTNENPTNLKFTYVLECTEQDFQFKWIKVLDIDDIKALLGNIKVIPEPDYINSVRDVLLLASTNISDQLSNIKILNQKMEQFEKEKLESDSALSEAVAIKENNEKKMYAKFVVVLNQKKSKIRELNGVIDSLKNEEDISSANSKNHKRKSLRLPKEIESQVKTSIPGTSGKSRRRIHEMSPEFSDDDEVPPPKSVKPKPRKRVVTRPSSKRATRHNLDVLESDEEDCDGLLDCL